MLQLSVVRGKGLLNAIVVTPKNRADGTTITAWDVCMAMSQRGVLAKPTQKHTIRLAPPLTVGRAEVEEAVAAIDAAFADCGI